MSLRPPANLSPGPYAPVDLLGHEILAEKASALGRAGLRVETTLQALRNTGRDSPERPARLHEAADAVYWYFIQRELCGLRRHAEIIREYAIPGEVLARLGAR